MPVNYPTSLDDTTSLPDRTTGDVIPASDSDDKNALLIALESKVGIGASTPTANKVLRATGTGTTAYAQVNLATDVTGVLPIANVATGTPTGSKFVRDDGVLAAPAGGGDALTTNPLSQFAATTSAQLAATLSDETGTGAAVFGTSPTLVTPALGTPASGVATNLTGLPIATGVSGLGTGVATLLATPSSANLAAALTDETGSGAAVFATSPTLVTPALGTPSALVATNATGTATGLTAGDSSKIGGIAVTGTPAVGYVPTATSTSAATWQAAAGGTVKPQIRYTLVGYNTGGTPLIAYDSSGTTGATSAVTTSGITIASGTATAGHEGMTFPATSPFNATVWSNTWDHNPKFVCQVGLSLAGGDGKAFIGMGGTPQSDATSDNGAAWKLVGFRHVRSGGTSTWYAVSGSGTAETATNITTAVTAITAYSIANTARMLTLAIEMTSGTNIKFYFEGVLVATITTNLPSGNMSIGQTKAHLFIDNNGAGAVSNTILTPWVEVTMDAY